MINFVKSQGDYDFVSPIQNLAGNAFVYAGAALGVAAITKVALEAMGYSATAAYVAASFPLVFSIGTACVGVVAIGAIAYIALNTKFS